MRVPRLTLGQDSQQFHTAPTTFGSRQMVQSQAGEFPVTSEKSDFDGPDAQDVMACACINGLRCCPGADFCEPCGSNPPEF